MNEEVFNLDMRKFLKRFGVTAQREIERVVQEGIASGRLKGTETLRVEARLTIAGVEEEHVVDGEISLA